MNKPLILVSGLPGTGKTRLALELGQTLQIPVLAKDRLQANLRLLGLTGRNGPDGYHLILDLADQQLALGVGAILDAVFPMNGFRLRARAMAQTYRAPFRPIFCTCSDEALWRARLEVREQFVPHWSPVGWEEVERIRPIFEPWEMTGALFLDAADDFGANLSKALQWLGVGADQA
jgi:predicted kinase